MFFVTSSLQENGCYCVTGLRLHPHFGSDTKVGIILVINSAEATMVLPITTVNADGR